MKIMKNEVSVSVRQAFFDSIYGESLKHFQADPEITKLIKQYIKLEIKKAIDELKEEKKSVGFND